MRKLLKRTQVVLVGHDVGGGGLGHDGDGEDASGISDDKSGNTLQMKKDDGDSWMADKSVSTSTMMY